MLSYDIRYGTYTLMSLARGKDKDINYGTESVASPSIMERANWSSEETTTMVKVGVSSQASMRAYQWGGRSTTSLV